MTNIETARSALAEVAMVEAKLGAAIAELLGIKAVERPITRRVDELYDRLKLEQKHLNDVQGQIVALINVLPQEGE